MPLPTTPWTIRLREMLERGPVSRDEAITAMADLVPPGRAFRDTERVVAWVRAHHDYKTLREYQDPKIMVDRRIRSGQRRIVRSTLWTQIEMGRVEEYLDHGRRMLRKGPNWPSRGTI